MSPQTVFERAATPVAISTLLIDAASRARDVAQGANYDKDTSLTHSWLFTGPPGSGRSVSAQAFAAALVCSNPTQVGCGECEDCRLTMRDAHPDVVHIVPQELVISVSSIRSIIVDAAKMPSAAQWRIIIIEDADRLSESAANALLKTVEEPPERTFIFLCAPSTDPQDIAITLRSRCRHVYIPTPSIAEVTRILAAEDGISESDAALAASASAGHIGRARHLVRSSIAQIRRANVINLAELIFHGDLAFRAVTTLTKSIEKEAETELAAQNAEELEKLRTTLGFGAKGKGAQKALRGTASQLKELEDNQKRRKTRYIRDSLDLGLIDLAGIYRDALMIASHTTIDLTHPDMRGLSEELGEKVSTSELLDCLDAITACRATLGMNVRPAVALDALVGKLRIAYKLS